MRLSRLRGRVQEGPAARLAGVVAEGVVPIAAVDADQVHEALGALPGERFARQAPG